MSPLSLGAINLIVSDSFMCMLATVSVALRFLSIYRLKRTIKLHDWLIVVALVCVYGQTICAIVGARIAGYGLHMKEVEVNDPTQIENAIKIFFIASIFWLVSTLTFRSAILLLYLELFGSSRTFKYCCCGTQALVILMFIGGLTLTLRLCTPVEYTWNRNIEGSCGDGDAGLAAAATMAAILDLVTVALPLPIVWRLHMAVQKKVAITATFALGLSICGINVARLVSTELCKHADFTYCTPYTMIFMVGEVGGSILVACVPTLGPVFFPQRYRPVKNGNSNWQHLDNGGTGKKSRIARTAAVHQDVLDDECELLDVDLNVASTRVELSSDSLAHTGKHLGNIVHIETLSSTKSNR